MATIKRLPGYDARCMARPKTFDRNAVLDAAVGVYRKDGVATSLAVMARIVGVNRSTFYSEFGSRRGFLVATLERYGPRFRGPGLDQLGEGARDAVLGLFEPIVEQAWCLLVAVVLAEPRLDHQVARIIEQALVDLQRRLGEAIQRGQALGEIDDSVDAGYAARLLAGQYLSLRVLARSGFSKGRALDAARTLSGLLLPPPIPQ